MRVKTYVQLVCLTALIEGAVIWLWLPGADQWNVGVLLPLAILALVAELLGYALPRAATGTISFVPYIAIVLLVPDFSALYSVVVAACIANLSLRKGALKLVFN